MSKPFATPYTSPTRRAQWAIGILILIAVLAGAAILSNLSERDLLQRIKDGEFVSRIVAAESDNRQHTIGLLQLGASILSAASFLAWFNLTYRNLLAFGISRLQYSPRWTWLGFVIPILNAFRPYQVASEIWKASNPDRRLLMGDVDPVVQWWWGGFLVLNALEQFVTRVYLNIRTIDDLLEANFMAIFVDGGVILAVVITIAFIRSLTERQDQKYTAMLGTPQTA